MYCMHAMHACARKQHDASYTWREPLISRSQGACDDLCEVRTCTYMYVQRTGTCAMATVEVRWKESVDNLIALLDERPCLYKTKLEIILTEIKRRPSTR